MLENQLLYGLYDNIQRLSSQERKLLHADYDDERLAFYKVLLARKIVTNRV